MENRETVPPPTYGRHMPFPSKDLALLWRIPFPTETKPDEIDLHRKGARQHLAFGHGIHLCLGAPIGRMEGRIAMEQLLERTEWVELAGDDFPHRKSVFVRTLERLPVRVRPK